MSAIMTDTQSHEAQATSEQWRIGRIGMHGRILVAGNCSDGSETLSKMLLCMGLDVAVCENGRAAFQIAFSSLQDGCPFDLVLMETEMPEIDGYEAAALLRSVGYRGPLIAIAPVSIEGVCDRALAAGFDGYLIRPTPFRALTDAVGRYLPAEQNSQVIRTA